MRIPKLLFQLALLAASALAYSTLGFAQVLEIATLERKASSDFHYLHGVVEATQSATLSAQTQGRIAQVLVDVDDWVEANQVLLHITSVQQQAGASSARAMVNAAQARLNELQKDLARMEDLYQRELVAKALLEQTTARHATALAELNAAKASQSSQQQELAYTVVRAPYAGIVSERLVEVGEAVQAGKPLLNMLSMDNLRVQVNVPQTQINALRQFKQAIVPLAGHQTISADKVSVFPNADPQSHTFKVRVQLPAALPESAGLRPGMTVSVGLMVGETEKLLLPKTALHHRGDLTVVYVVDAEQQVRMRQVRVGRSVADGIEVLAGLAVGESVALNPLAAAAAVIAQRAARDE